MNFTGLAAVAAVGAVLVLSACSSSGGGTAGSSDGGGSGSGSGSGSSASATLSGDYKGTIAANNCAAAGIMSIAVTIDGTKYNGSISATEAGFVGPDAVDFATAPDKDPALPTISSDGNTFTLGNVHVYDLIGGKSAIMNGSITCP